MKKGDKTNMSNYRSVSLLTTFSKLLEKVIHIRLSHYLRNNNILVSEQFGFRKGMCIEDAAFKLTDSIAKSKLKTQVGGIFCDLVKSFDYVNHRIILTKLCFTCIQGTTLSWFRSYLTDGKRRLKKSHQIRYKVPTQTGDQ
jgi:hypothetical protein